MRNDAIQPEDISRLIEAEVAGNWDRSNAHGVDLRTSLVSPQRKLFRCQTGETRGLRLVLEENPKSRGGYKIVFDEVRGEFGLATADVTNPVDFFLGIYGSFIESFDAM